MRKACFENSVFILQAAGLVAAILIAGTAAAASLKIDTLELQKKIEAGVPVVDVRTSQEWRATGVIPGSHLLTFFDSRGNYDLSGWLSRFTEIAKPHEPVVIICEVGNRSEVISGFLSTRAGYHQVYDATRGMREWIALSMPTHKWP